MILSGFHILEGRDASYRNTRLSNVVHELLATVSSLPSPHPRLHVELASMTDAAFVRVLLDTLLPHVQSLGLNEQELATAYTAIGGTSLTRTQLSAKVPDVASVVQVLTLIMNTYKHGALTRIHFHSLAFHIIATRYVHPTVHVAHHQLYVCKLIQCMNDEMIAYS